VFLYFVLLYIKRNYVQLHINSKEEYTKMCIGINQVYDDNVQI
jgi:hypothetical protein